MKTDGIDPVSGLRIESMIDYLRGEHIVTAFSRLHPILDLPLDPLRHHGTVVLMVKRSSVTCMRLTMKCGARLAIACGRTSTSVGTPDSLPKKKRQTGGTSTRSAKPTPRRCARRRDRVRLLRSWLLRAIDHLPGEYAPARRPLGRRARKRGNFFGDVRHRAVSPLRHGAAFLRSEASHLLLHSGREWAKARGTRVRSRRGSRRGEGLALPVQAFIEAARPIQYLAIDH